MELKRIPVEYRVKLARWNEGRARNYHCKTIRTYEIKQAVKMALKAKKEGYNVTIIETNVIEVKGHDN